VPAGVGVEPGCREVDLVDGEPVVVVLENQPVPVLDEDGTGKPRDTDQWRHGGGEQGERSAQLQGPTDVITGQRHVESGDP